MGAKIQTFFSNRKFFSFFIIFMHNISKKIVIFAPINLDRNDTINDRLWKGHCPDSQ